MKCLECQRSGVEHSAIAVCHHCLSGLCAAHLRELSDPVLIREPICKTVVLPLRARFFLCETCGRALNQLIERGLPVARAETAMSFNA
jgi:hypothetical protein